jgi:5-methylcytosine-specific restriction endonuclease McrA
MTDPGEEFPSSWRDKPKNRERWEQLKRSTEYLRRQEAERGSLDCTYCGQGPLRIYHWSEVSLYAVDVATVDHVVPRAGGGGDDDSNLVVSCQRCNARKGATY